MGNFRIVVNAVGGHGCHREKKDGQVVVGCKSMTCPDCVTQEFVNRMATIATLNSAELIHWPEQPGTVTDEIFPTTYKLGSYNTGEGEQKYVETTPGYRLRHGSF